MGFIYLMGTYNLMLGCPFYAQSFDIPGSVDANDKQVEQWNSMSHVLSFWSRHDWTTKHKVIAQEHGHVSYSHEVLEMDTKMLPADYDRDGNNVDKHMQSYDLVQSTDDKEDEATTDEGKKSSSHHGNVEQESKEEPECRKRKSGKTSRKRKHVGENYSLAAKRQAVNGKTKEVANHRQPNPNNEKSSAEGSQPHRLSRIEMLSRGEKEKQQRESDEREPGSATKPSYKLNHVRMMGSEPPTVNRNGTCDRSVPQPGYGVTRQLTFASGPNLEYSLRHSVGWLDE
ncbi:hypothetical protein Lalb_Chr00c48g0412891 [Lupinus albus]|uniref:DM2 domain-containing protein n=1 Tax=Lupinus albus TaxID=3870 RepID=A0A6A4N0M0_LUPAL|nr:hypothetical protein Lalb_Chr00c48g0412891 [Lupinus albus]